MDSSLPQEMIAILFREELKEYDFGTGHPLRGNRFESFPEFLRRNLRKNQYRIIEADPAQDEDLYLICDKDYVEFNKKFFNTQYHENYYEFYQFHTVDNLPMRDHGKLEEAARLIVGQAKRAADLIQSEQFKKVVSIGGGLHHAKPSHGEGFCIYNDVAFAAKYLMKKYDLKRILILDTDAHAGNGTSEYFYRDDRVLFIDLHQDPNTLYPFTTGFANQIGEGKGKGYTVNVPMPKYAGDESYELVFDEIIQPLSEQFKPQMIIRNGGSDPYFGDPLTKLGLSMNGLKMIGSKVRELSKICDGKVIDLIISGYNDVFLKTSWLALISGLAGIEVKIKEEIPQRFRKDISLEKTREVIREVKKNLKDYWKF